MAPFNGPSGQELRSTNKPMYGSSAVNVDDTIYIYGGFYSTPPWNMEGLWKLDIKASNAEITQVATNPYASPALIYSQLLSPNKGALYAFGGHHPVDLNATQPPEPLRYYRFDFSSHAWTPLQKKSAPPHERYWHTATMSTDRTKAYIFGGMNITGGVDDHFWIYDFALDKWIAGVTEQVTSRCGHTASMLSDGNLVILGGYICTGNYTTNALISKQLYSLDSAAIYDTAQGFWRTQKLGGSHIPAPRTYHSAVTTHEDKIIVCGGQDGAAQPFQKYLAGDGDKAAMTAILDTKSWTWSFPPPSPYQPFPRSHATAAVINGTTMIFGFGINYHTIFDGIYIFNSVDNVWLPPVTPDASIGGNQATSVGSIAAVTTVLGLALILAVWLLLRRLRITVCQVGRKILQGLWTPRAGEPLWAEVTRLLCRLIFFGILIVVVVMMVFQIRDSPIIDQKYYSRRDDNTIDVPDIRFCFDGWEYGNNAELPYLQCSTDFGVSCSEYLSNITKEVQSGLNYYGKGLQCFLFRTPESFRLGYTNDRLHGSGSYLKFYYYGERLPSNQSRVHISFYNKYHDPNFAAYGISDPYNMPFSWYHPGENAEFQSMEQENLRTDNSFDLDPNVVSTASYSLYERDSIRSNESWNYVGIAVIRDKTFGIETSVKSESLVSEYASNPQPLGSLHIFPTSYDLAIIREQRAFSLLNAMGIVGGIFGLIVGLQAYLFGYRPRSPWGVIHRWSVGQMRRSLLQGLSSTFPKSVNVPIVHPVHRRFSVATSRTRNFEHPVSTAAKQSLRDPGNKNNQVKTATLPEDDYDEEDSNRMARLEERMHVMEMLFQAYYINDEVFQSLAHALQSDLRQERHDRRRKRKFSFFDSQNNEK